MSHSVVLVLINICYHPVNMLDPIHIWSGLVQKWAWSFSLTGLLLDQIHLAKTWCSQPEPNWIHAGLAQHDLDYLWKNAFKSESGKLVGGQLHSSRIWPHDSWTLTCFLTRYVRPKADQAIQTGSGLVLHKMIWAFFGRTKLNWIQEVVSGIYDLAQFWQHTSSLILAACWPKWP